MADRTVTAKLVGNYSGYTPGTQTATKATSELVAAQKEAATSNKAEAEAAANSATAKIEASRQTRLLTTAQRDATAAAREAAAANSEATASLSAAQKEVAAATKDTSELAAARQAAAREALDAAEKEAAAAAATKAAADVQTKSATAALRSFKDETAASRENSAEQAANAKVTEDAAKKRSDAYTGTSKVALVAGAALAAGFYEAEKATSEFNKSLSTVQAVANASASDMDKLRGAALQAGKDTAFTATEAANAEGELVKAGVSVTDVLGGALQGSLSLAAAGNLNLADAATISANAMNTFALKGSDVGHIADVFAAAANKSAADVQTLAYAMQQGGLVAAQTGLSFEDTTAILAAFADRGLQGADAGTSLKTMLEKLNAPTTQSKNLMQQLGIVTYDASGKFVGITQLAGELHDKLGTLTDAQRNQALATIFGSDAIRAASVLYSLGAQGVQGYSQAVNDNGAAARMASEQMNNFSGDLKQLKGSIDVALIQGGSGANVVLRDMAQNATKAVNAFASLPKWLQEASVGFAGGAGTSLLLVGGLTSLAGKAASTKKTLAEVSEASTGMKGALASAGSFMAGPWGLAIAGAATVIGIFASRHTAAKVAVASFTDAIKEDGNAIGNATTQAVAADLASKKLFDIFNKLGISSTTVTNAALGNADALKQVTDAADAAAGADTRHGASGMKQAVVIMGAANAVKSYGGALHDQLGAQQQVTAATQGSTAATGTSAAETAKATAAAKDAAATAMEQAAGQRAVSEAQAADADGSKAVATAAEAAATATASGADAQKQIAQATSQAVTEHEEGTKWLLAVADAEAMATGSARDLDSSVTDEVGAMKDAQTTAGTLKDALDALNGVHIAASRAAVAEQQKVADLTKALSDNGRTLDITTVAGRANVTAIDDMASAANAHAQAVTEESGSIDAGNKALDASRVQFDAVLKSAGYSTAQIDAFNNSLLNTPKMTPITIQVQADTSAANAALQALQSKYAGTGLVFGGGPGGKHLIPGYATGGQVIGSGTGTSDSNAVAVSNKEYIVKASAVARPGVLAELNALNFGSGNATVVRPQISAGGAAYAGGSGRAGSSGGGVQIELVSSGAEDYFLRFMRHAIRVRGGNVQSVLGAS